MQSYSSRQEQIDPNQKESPINILYIAGLGRSASTILHRTLGEIAGFFPAGEIMHIGRGFCTNESCTCGEQVRNCEVWGKVSERFEKDLITDAPLVDFLEHKMQTGRYVFNMCSIFSFWRPGRFVENLQAYKKQLFRVYRAVRETTGCRFIVDSSKNAAYAKVLSEIPQIRLYVVHLVRDSRGVAFSFRKKKQRPGVPGRLEYLDRHNPIMAALLWCLANFLAERLRKKCVRYLRVCYRDFANAPEKTIQHILRGINAYNGTEQLSHLTDHSVELNKHHILSGNPVRSQHGRIKISEDLEWESEMRLSRKILVTFLTFPFLMRYGYFSRNGKHNNF